MDGIRVELQVPAVEVASLSSRQELEAAIDMSPHRALLLLGDAAETLGRLPSNSVDFAMTSPPYWGHRDYSGGGIGQEDTPQEFVDALLEVFGELHRVLRPEGSFWLNLGDTYRSKALQGIPWRVALAMMDRQGWVMRNDVIWNKVKGAPDNAKDKLRNLHEHVFHFVKDRKRTYYDLDAIRAKPRKALQRNGKVVSATGVSGSRYRRQIEITTTLSSGEKKEALAALQDMLAQVAAGTYSDFRMVIRGVQRVTHSDSTRLSGRAKELAEKGYYFLRYHPKGAKPADIWDIIPEDTHGRKGHYAPYPARLCEIPIMATCPKGGIVLDPFAGTGTTLAVASGLGRRCVGIDLAEDYIGDARQRLQESA